MMYSKLLGERLRNVRVQKGMSLHDVELASGREFKTSALGAYERGERTIPIQRLQRLARLYRVPLEILIPDVAGESVPMRIRSEGSPGCLTINLGRLDQVDGPEKVVLERFVRSVIAERGDLNGRVISIRAGDFKAIASVLDLSVDALSKRLVGMGLLAAGPPAAVPQTLAGTMGQGVAGPGVTTR